MNYLTRYYRRVRRHLDNHFEQYRLRRQLIWFGLGPCGCVVAWMVHDADRPLTDGPTFTPAILTTLTAGMSMPSSWVLVRGVDNTIVSKLSPMQNHDIIPGRERDDGFMRSVDCNRLGGPETCKRPDATLKVIAAHYPQGFPAEVLQ